MRVKEALRRLWAPEILIAGVMLPLCIAYTYWRPGISWNGSESLPIGLYWHTRTQLPVPIGELVCTRYRAPAWAQGRDLLPEGMLICKQVLGIAGDRVRRVGDRIEICNSQACRDGGRLVQRDRRARLVQAAPFPQVIPAGFVYLGSLCSERSFDSRYLGLVSETELVRTLHFLPTILRIDELDPCISP